MPFDDSCTLYGARRFVIECRITDAINNARLPSPPAQR
jgi:hypothetical protein